MSFRIKNAIIASNKNKSAMAGKIAQQFADLAQKGPEFSSQHPHSNAVE